MSRLKKLANIDDIFEIDELVKIKVNNDWVLGQIYDMNSNFENINNYIYFVETHEDTYSVKNTKLLKYEGKEFDIIHIGDEVEFNTAIQKKFGKVFDFSYDGSIVFIEAEDDTYNVKRYEVRKRS